jgi:hypothetical protein
VINKQEFTYVRNHILDTRFKKLKYNYNFSAKNGAQIKRLMSIFLSAEVLAAWDIFIQDLMDDPDRFWRKGYTVDMFCCNQCFSICQEHSLYRRYTQYHQDKLDKLDIDPAQMDFIKDNA